MRACYKTMLLPLCIAVGGFRSVSQLALQHQVKADCASSMTKALRAFTLALHFCLFRRAVGLRCIICCDHRVGWLLARAVPYSYIVQPRKFSFDLQPTSPDRTSGLQRVASEFGQAVKASYHALSSQQAARVLAKQSLRSESRTVSQILRPSF